MPRAPRRCPGANGTCTVLITAGKYCSDHQRNWSTSHRSASSKVTSTAAWRKLRARILERDGYQCRIQYVDRCTGYATTVDHIIPASRRPDLAMTPTNLQAACDPCNQHKARTTDKQRPA